MRPASDDTATMLQTCFPDLPQRESEVLGEAISGKGYQEIASTLGIRPTTARNYLQRILGKLGVHSQRQAVLKAALALVTRAESLPGRIPRTARGAGTDPGRLLSPSSGAR